VSHTGCQVLLPSSPLENILPWERVISWQQGASLTSMQERAHFVSDLEKNKTVPGGRTRCQPYGRLGF
jgi:hypothetical protein